MEAYDSLRGMEGVGCRWRNGYEWSPDTVISKYLLQVETGAR